MNGNYMCHVKNTVLSKSGCHSRQKGKGNREQKKEERKQRVARVLITGALWGEEHGTHPG